MMSPGEAAAADFLVDLAVVMTLGLVIGALFALPLRWLRARRVVGGGALRAQPAGGMGAAMTDRSDAYIEQVGGSPEPVERQDERDLPWQIIVPGRSPLSMPSLERAKGIADSLFDDAREIAIVHERSGERWRRRADGSWERLQ